MTFYRANIHVPYRPSLVRDLVAVGLATLLLTLSAKVSVPFYPVPTTLQSLVVIALGLLLGPLRGCAAVLLYLAEGAGGLAVFAGTPEKGVGLPYMAGPTGGYLAGFLLAVLVAGWLAERGWCRNPITATAAALGAAALVYVPGLLWLGVLFGFSGSILSVGLFPFLFADIVKAVLAALIAVALPRLAGRAFGRGMQ